MVLSRFFRHSAGACGLFGIALFFWVTVTEGVTSTTFRLQNGATMSTGAVYNGGEDTYFRQKYPEACPGMFPEMQIGFENYVGGGAVRGLIRFDVSQLKDGFTTGTG